MQQQKHRAITFVKAWCASRIFACAFGLAIVKHAGTLRKTLVRELQKEITIFLQMPRLSVARVGRLLN